MPFYSLTCQQAEAVAKLVDYKADQILFHHGAQEGSQLPEYKDLCSIVQELKSGGRVVESGEVPDSE